MEVIGDSKLDLDLRIRLPDGREGFVMEMFYPAHGRETVVVLTDSYVKVKCRPDQLALVQRRANETTKWDYAHKKMYPTEAENCRRLRRAIWHAHWKRFGHWDYEVPGFIGECARLYTEGQREPLPTEEDISLRQDSQPRQLTLL